MISQQRTQADARAAQLAALRGNCMGAAVLLIIQFGIGTGVNLYVTIPVRKSFFPAVLGSATLSAHTLVALLLLGAAISALVRAIRARKLVALTSVGLTSILAAAIAVFSLRQPRQGSSDN